MAAKSPELDDALRALRALHADVDARAEALASRHTGRLRCGRGCAACCVDGLGVFEVEAERIRRAHPQLLESGDPHPPGACAFLDAEGACRIYADRPYVCRTQGLPLRWLAEPQDGETVELRDICELNLAGPPLEGLPEEDLWSIGPVEARLATLQATLDGGKLRRVALRALFRSLAGVLLANLVCGGPDRDAAIGGGPRTDAAPAALRSLDVPARVAEAAHPRLES